MTAQPPEVNLKCYKQLKYANFSRVNFYSYQFNQPWIIYILSEHIKFNGLYKVLVKSQQLISNAEVEDYKIITSENCHFLLLCIEAD